MRAFWIAAPSADAPMNRMIPPNTINTIQPPPAQLSPVQLDPPPLLENPPPELPPPPPPPPPPVAPPASAIADAGSTRNADTSRAESSERRRRMSATLERGPWVGNRNFRCCVTS